jgi:hypothetical protein
MKRVFLVFLSVMVFASCVQKKDTQVKDSPEEPVINSETETEPAPKKDIAEYDAKQVLLFQIEGNFTNSGNKEVLAFYQKKARLKIEGRDNKEIDSAYVFVIDLPTGNIIHAYELQDYGTLPFDISDDIDESLMEELGRGIFWGDQRLGSIGDFNENGKEEIYLYTINSFGIDPMFYEFTGKDFSRILTYEGMKLYGITGIDPDRKILSFAGYMGGYKTLSYIWDAPSQLYMFMPSDGDLVNKNVPDT